MGMTPNQDFQSLVLNLQNWADHVASSCSHMTWRWGRVLSSGHDAACAWAGAMSVAMSRRRLTDGRYGGNLNRLQHYYQRRS